MPDPAIFESLRDDFVLIAQYTDDQNDEKPAKVFERFFPEGGSIPVYMVLDTDGNVLSHLEWPADRPNMTKEEYLAFMKEGLAKFAALKK
ncbi:MAG: hypothetical protein H6841_03445 [Planctomycetes bacterium]|nr:hypothetical protein [Planctomycetota bacterium]MCB9934174.1 hypothetical protein [Planctomycetota bacterium]